MNEPTLLLALLLVARFDAGAQEDQDAPAPAEVSDRIAVSEHFAFFSHSQVNLHHFLYQWGRTEQTVRVMEDRRPRVEVSEKGEVAELIEADRGVWEDAADRYARLWVARDLLFDSTMDGVKRTLVGHRIIDSRAEHAMIAEMTRTVDAALPVYASRWWTGHDRANRAWVEAVLPKLERFETEIAERIARAHGGHWPEEPIRVDMSAYANWAGAYTSVKPTHITLSSTDTDNMDWGSLEILMHEASHSDELEGPLTSDLEAAFAARGAKPPRNLWHAMLFHTSGEATRAVLEEAGVSGYEPYAVRGGLYDRAPGWAEFKAALDRHWLPFLSGEAERDAALAAIAKDLAQ